MPTPSPDFPSPAFKDMTAQRIGLTAQDPHHYHHGWLTAAESDEMKKGFYLFSQQYSSCNNPFRLLEYFSVKQEEPGPASAAAGPLWASSDRDLGDR